MHKLDQRKPLLVIVSGTVQHNCCDMVIAHGEKKIVTGS